jgi:hypothetical protein
MAKTKAADAVESPADKGDNKAEQVIARSRSFAEFLRQHQPSPLDTVKHIEGFCAELEALAAADAPNAAEPEEEPK